MACYGHYETDATFDEGAANGGDASVTCAPAEWGGKNSDQKRSWLHLLIDII